MRHDTLIEGGIMKSISLYEPLSTPIHRLEPLAKLLYIVTVILLPVIWNSKLVALGCIMLSMGLLAYGKVIRKTIPLTGFSCIVLVSVVLIQGLFRAENTTVVWQIGPLVFYEEGLRFALGIVTNVINILLSFSILVLTTKPSDLIESLVGIGLSPKIGYVLGSVFQIIPQMSATMETITDAQRSRGMETEGNLRTRFKAFIPLMGPVVMSSLINTKERAIALEVRGFSSHTPKCYLNIRVRRTVDKTIKIVLGMILILSILGRGILWLYLK